MSSVPCAKPLLGDIRVTPRESTSSGPSWCGEMRGTPGSSESPTPDSGLPQVAVQAGSLQCELWGRGCAEDPVLCPGPQGGQGRRDPARCPVPGAASPRATGGLQPRALPAQVSSLRMSSRGPELLVCADASLGAMGTKGRLLGTQETALRKRYYLAGCTRWQR